MNGRIFGFQRLARWPKCTPDSIKSWTCTIATQHPPAADRKPCVRGIDRSLGSKQKGIVGWVSAWGKRRNRDSGGGFGYNRQQRRTAQAEGRMTPVTQTHIWLDDRGVAWIDDTNV